MIADDLLSTARRLAKASPRKPRQADLRRAISTAYYALFHAMAFDCANLLVGSSANVAAHTWAHTYRALDHGLAKNICMQARALGFPEAISLCAADFLNLQRRRHEADYDPLLRLKRADAADAIALAETAISNLRGSHKMDRRAFAVQLLLKRR